MKVIKYLLVMYRWNTQEVDHEVDSYIRHLPHYTHEKHLGTAPNSLRVFERFKL